LDGSPPDFSVSDAEDLLQLVYSKPSGTIVIVGGQAVNFWADRFLSDTTKLKPLRPFTSRDLDLLGEIANAYRLAEQIHVDLRRPRKSSATPVLANIDVPVGEAIRAVQFLRSVGGVTKREITDNAVGVEVRGVKCYVADPITMLRSKLYNLVELDQAGRNDQKHVEILELCIPVFIRRQLDAAEENDHATHTALRTMQRLLTVAASKQARRAWANLTVAEIALRLLPSELEKMSNERLCNFRERQLARWIMKHS
jgi:hypothetical protein